MSSSKENMPFRQVPDIISRRCATGPLSYATSSQPVCGVDLTITVTGTSMDAANNRVALDTAQACTTSTKPVTAVTCSGDAAALTCVWSGSAVTYRWLGGVTYYVCWVTSTDKSYVAVPTSADPSIFAMASSKGQVMEVIGRL